MQFPSPAADQAAVTGTSSHVLPITFTGSGSEYFRIWIVNLLLTICTLGLYFPFAKVRRLSYFHGNTVVGGQPLGFHGDPRKMLRGFLLMLLLGLVYSVAVRYSPASALGAIVVLAVVWPALWRASLQFRLANTSWRGLRFRFTGDLAGAYRAMLPAFVPGGLMVGATLLEPPAGPTAGAATSTFLWAFGGAFLVSLLLAPLLIFVIKRYQHGHYQLAAEQTRFTARPGTFYKLSLSSVGLAIGSTVLSVGVIGLVYFLLIRQGLDPQGAVGKAVLFGGLMVAYLLAFFVPWPYWTARVQNLLWNHTETAQLHFHSQLKARSMLVLMLKNLALTLLTLGLYRPFAAVATARLRLQAMSVTLTGDVDAWMADADVAAARDASGELAGDFFGIDLGL